MPDIRTRAIFNTVAYRPGVRHPMIFVLLILFAVAASVTVIGFLLSLKPTLRPQIRKSQEMSYAEPVGKRMGRSVRIDTARSTRLSLELDVKVKQRSVYNWSSVVGVITRGQRTGESLPWTGVAVVLIAVFLLGLYLLRAVLPSLSRQPRPARKMDLQNQSRSLEPR